MLIIAICYNGFNAAESREVSVNGKMYDFSVYYTSIDKSDLLNIHKYLMIKNDIKKCPALLIKWLLSYCLLVNL